MDNGFRRLPPDTLRWDIFLYLRISDKLTCYLKKKNYLLRRSSGGEVVCNPNTFSTWRQNDRLADMFYEWSQWFDIRKRGTYFWFRGLERHREGHQGRDGRDGRDGGVPPVRGRSHATCSEDTLINRRGESSVSSACRLTCYWLIDFTRRKQFKIS